ncbi:MMPL family transporter [Corallincola platygyrae]
MNVSADLMALFPEFEQSELQEQASFQLAFSQGRRVVLLVRSADAKRLQEQAPHIESVVASSKLFEPDDRLMYRTELSRLYQPFFPQLLSAQMRELLRQEPDVAVMRGISDFYNPFSGVSPQEFFTDPVLVQRDFLLSHAKGQNLRMEQGRLWTNVDGQEAYLLPLLLREEPYDFDIQDRLLNLIEQIEERWPDFQISYTGTAFYAAAGANSARTEISTIGVGSLVGILLLITYVFRSLKPLVLALIAIGSGVFAAFVVTHFFFENVHLFTLVFGACLIGVSIDYAFHFFAHRFHKETACSASESHKAIFPGISLGLLSSGLAYAALACAPFPGLRQVALFSVVGLLMAYLTVMLAFPILANFQLASVRTVPWAQSGLISLWSQWSPRRRFSIWLFGALITLPLVWFLPSDDDVRSLQGLDPALSQMELEISEAIGLTTSPRYWLVRANTVEELLQREEQLFAQVEARDKDSRLYAVSQFVPSRQRQQENLHIYQQMVLPHVADALTQAGFPEDLAAKRRAQLAEKPFEPLMFDTWLQSNASIPWRFLWLEQRQGSVASIVLMRSKLPTENLTVLNSEQVELIDQAAEFSSLFGRYREEIAWLLLFAYGAIFALLKIRYSWFRAAAVLAVPAGASLLTLGGLSLCGVQMNLFHMLALTLVTGISIDYSVFFAETQRKPNATLLAIALASATTLLSFGLLALSATPAVQSVGVTVSLGILFAYLLGPLAFFGNQDQKDRAC